MADEEAEAEFIQPPDTLKSKVSYGPGGVDLEALERAEAVIAGLQDNYVDWVQDDLRRLQALYQQTVGDPAERKERIDAMFRIAHDIKGQGGSFGYDLMTRIGNQLCRLMEGRDDLAPAEFEVVRLHIDAMRLIIGERMQGDGGRVGENLVRGLEAVLDKLNR